MNTKLIDSLVQIINSLSVEERKMFEEKIYLKSEQITTQQIMDLAEKGNSFDFQRSDNIRVKGTRIGIESILYDFIYRCQTPEEIAQAYSSLNLQIKPKWLSDCLTKELKNPSIVVQLI